MMDIESHAPNGSLVLDKNCIKFYYQASDVPYFIDKRTDIHTTSYYCCKETYMMGICYAGDKELTMCDNKTPRKTKIPVRPELSYHLISDNDNILVLFDRTDTCVLILKRSSDGMLSLSESRGITHDRARYQIIRPTKLDIADIISQGIDYSRIDTNDEIIDVICESSKIVLKIGKRTLTLWNATAMPDLGSIVGYVADDEALHLYDVCWKHQRSLPKSTEGEKKLPSELSFLCTKLEDKYSTYSRTVKVILSDTKNKIYKLLQDNATVNLTSIVVAVIAIIYLLISINK